MQEEANDGDAAVALAQGSAKCREILRQARCRIDAMAMQGFRAYWKDLVDNDRVDAVNLWIDGSPQWRGVEMFAGSLEVWVGDEVQRWLIPCVCLEAGQLDGASEMKALLWAWFLMTGPNRHYLQRLLSLVTGIVTDHGVESAVVDMPGCIGALLASIGGKHEDGEDGTHLFPRGLLCQGWKHVFDGALRRVLTSLEWFPQWLAQFKAICSLLHDRNKNSVFVKALRS